MQLRILSRCIEHSIYARPLPVVINRVEPWHLLYANPSNYCPVSAKPDHRFYCSTIINSCNSVQNVSTDSGICASKSSEFNYPLLSQDTDLDQLDENWKSLLENCACHLASLSDDQLEILLRNILAVRSKIDYKDLLKFTFTIDQELTKRAPSWTIESILNYFELYSDLPQLKRVDFVHYLLKYRQHKIFRCDLNVVTKFMKLMNKSNLWHIYHVPKFNYETCFSNNLTNLSIADLEVFLEFMVKVSLVVNTPNLFHQFCTFVLAKLPELSSSGVVWFCQILRLRQTIGFDRVFIDSIFEQLVQRLGECSHFHANAFIEAASLCREESVVGSQFFHKFSLKLTHQLGDLSLHRLAEGMKWLTFFDDNCKHSAVYDCVVNHLRAKSFDEVSQHPINFILIIYYLSRVGVYPADLLDMLFSPKFLAKAYPKGFKFPLREYYVFGQELLTIDGGVEIECPNYRGNRLNPNDRHNIQRYYCWKMPKLLSGDLEGVNFEELVKFSRASSRTLYTTRLALEKILGGAEFVHTCYLLPHLPRPNLVFAMSEGKPVPLASSIRKIIVDRSALDNNLDWYTFAIYSFGDQTSSSQGSLRAEEIPKVRQLKKLGLNVLKLVHKEWSAKSETEIEQCLQNRIYRYVESEFQN